MMAGRSAHAPRAHSRRAIAVLPPPTMVHYPAMDPVAGLRPHCACAVPAHNGVHHVFQGCPRSSLGPEPDGWHHAASIDLVHWEDRGIGPGAQDESWHGFTSKKPSPPCSGFVTVDDDGAPCAGYRSCQSATGLSDSGNPNATWNAPLELRCAENANLTQWGPPDYIFPVYFARGLPYDPPRPWKDTDGQWYAAISTDGCNYTHDYTKSHGCAKGGQLQIYTSPKLHGDGAAWRYIGPMITTASLPGNGQEYCGLGTPRSRIAGCHTEFVTSGYFGSIKGDPRGGRTRVVTANQAPGNPSSTVYYIGRAYHLHLDDVVAVLHAPVAACQCLFLLSCHLNVLRVTLPVHACSAREWK